MSSDDDTTKFEQVKQHLKKNKRVYAAAAGGVVVGGSVVGIIMLRHAGFQIPEIQQTAKNTALIVWKSPPTNIVLVKPELRPPQPILDKTTGIPYPSMNEAARQTGEAIGKIRVDAHGTQQRFAKLPETIFA